MATVPFFVCRVCMCKVSKNHYCLLFSPGVSQKKFSSRLGSLLKIEVDAQDGLPSLICEKCKRRFETLEKAMPALTEFQQLAKASLFTFSIRGKLEAQGVQCSDWGITRHCQVQTSFEKNYCVKATVQQYVN